jgi:hypothetical protein
MKSAILAVALVAATTPAAALEPEIRETLGASINLPGIQNTIEVVWKGPRRTVGIGHAVTPSHTRINGFVQLSAGPAFDVRAGLEPVLYHGASGSLVGFDDRGASFDEDARRGRSSHAAFGGRVYLAPAFRARLGAIVGTVGGELEWWAADTSHTFFYEPGRDTLVRADGGALLRGTAALLYERKGRNGARILAGVNDRYLHAPGASGLDGHRPGVLVQWTAGERRFALREPTLVVNVFRYVEDPFKRGEIGVNVALGCRLK